MEPNVIKLSIPALRKALQKFSFFIILNFTLNFLNVMWHTYESRSYLINEF